MKLKKYLSILVMIILLINLLYNFSFAISENHTISKENITQNTCANNNTITNSTNETIIEEKNNQNELFENTNSNITKENNETIEKIKNDDLLEKQNIADIESEVIDTNSSLKECETEIVNTTEETTDNIISEEPNQDDNSKVNPTIKELLLLSNITDINKLSTKVTQKQMEQIIVNYPSSKAKETINNATGIWINENSRELIQNFINNHSSYTYSIDENGYLTCDNILRVNEKLDIIEPAETEVDIAIKNVLELNKKIIIEISENYYEFNDNNIISYKIFENDTKSEAYEYDKTRIIVLNSKYYNNNEIEFNLPLSDNFIKILDNIQYKVLIGEIELTQEQINNEDIVSYASFTDSGQGLGTAKMGQTVYHGPNNNGTYCTVGSIDRNEQIAILGSEGDYYHILYAVTNSQNEKTGYVLKTNISTSATITEEIMTGGYRYANSGQDIKSRGWYNVAVSYGSVSNTEGVTLLYDYNVNRGSESYRVGFIEFWTGTGMKRGYIKMPYLNNPFTTKLAKASGKKTTYTGPNPSKFTSGTGAIGQGEYVCLLGYTGDYLFIEYNTNTGRRRAFCKASDLGINNISSLGITHLPDLQMTQGYLSSEKQDVSAGPGKAYSLCAYVGVIGLQESVYRQSTEGTNPYNQLGYTYIVFYAGESLKGGFVPESTLTRGKNPSIPDTPSSVDKVGGFQTAQIWQSGLGNPIHSYKIGIGDKRLYLIYAQHGFEDEGYGDGIELVDIAYNFMDYMYNNRNNNNIKSILSNWTIYVVPYLNRDGIESGHTMDGPGRCNIADSIDINRNWPTIKYVNYTDPRNYTGNGPLSTVEAKGLRDMLAKNDVKPVNKIGRAHV